MRSSMATLSRYVLGSTALAGFVIYHAFSTREQFFPAVVYLASSKIAIASLSNLCFAWSLFAYRIIVKVFLSELRTVEAERVNERLSQAVVETCLAMTIFREEFNTSFVAMFVLLTFVKVFHWLLQDRLEFLDTLPVVPRKTFVRILAFMFTLSAVDYFLMKYSLEKAVQSTASVHLLFGFEYVIQTIFIVSVMAKYWISVYDNRSEGRWQNKGLFTFYLELGTDMLNLFVYLIFFIMVFLNYGLPLHLVRDLYWTFKKFKNNVANFLRYRRLASLMESRFPDATAEELEGSENVCIICRDAMTMETRNKKLTCGHIFHLDCLRSWLERQQNCPTCRAAVAPPPPPAAQTPVNPENPQNPQPGPVQPQNNPAGGEANVVRPNQPRFGGTGHRLGAGTGEGPPGPHTPQNPRAQEGSAQTGGVPVIGGNQQPPNDQAGPSNLPGISPEDQEGTQQTSRENVEQQGYVLSPGAYIPMLSGMPVYSPPENQGGQTSAPEASQAQMQWTPQYAAPVFWNTPHFGIPASMALYLPAFQYAGQDRPQAYQMNVSAAVPMLPLVIPPSFPTPEESGILPPPANASEEDQLIHRRALQAARAATAVASSVYGSWHDNPLMLPPSLLNTEENRRNPEFEGVNQAQQQAAAAWGRAFASSQHAQDEYQRLIHRSTSLNRQQGETPAGQDLRSQIRNPPKPNIAVSQTGGEQNLEPPDPGAKISDSGEADVVEARSDGVELISGSENKISDESDVASSSQIPVEKTESHEPKSEEESLI